jgi:hypothetical protein
MAGELLQQAWQARQALYESLFGSHSFSLPKRYAAPVQGAGMWSELPAEEAADASADTSSPEAARSAFQEALDSLAAARTASARLMSVLAYAPAEGRNYWTYVTSGLSNPRLPMVSEVSGFGCELVCKSPSASRWPVKLLRRLVGYICSYSGTLSPGVILSMAAPIGAAASPLNNIFVWYADEAPDCWYQLPSGGFGVFAVIGITEDECRFAESVEQYGTWSIQQVLTHAGIGQVTDPARNSAMQGEGMDAIIHSIRAYAANFMTRVDIN